MMFEVVGLLFELVEYGHAHGLVRRCELLLMLHQAQNLSTSVLHYVFKLLKVNLSLAEELRTLLGHRVENAGQALLQG